jgi:type IV pilus assembly protein PilA
MTLVELMVVVAIIAIIAAIAITLYQDVQKKAKLAADSGTIAALRSAVAIYYGKHNGNFPDETILNTLVVPSPNFQCTGNDYSLDTANGKITFTGNDISGC